MQSRPQRAVLHLPAACLVSAGLVVAVSLTAGTGNSSASAETPPAAETSAPAVLADGQPATPTGALEPGPEWTPIIDEDFTTPAALGEFSDVYPGWAEYDGYRDTWGFGLYDSDRVVTVANGVLTKFLHTEDGEALITSITPVPHVQLYGRYEVRFRSDVIDGYKLAWLLWPADDDWDNGELDFPETETYAGAEIDGFAHRADGVDGAQNAWGINTGQSPHQWHTAVIEWRPDSLLFALDGVEYRTTEPLAIPHVPMYWSLQSETLGATPPADAAGGVHIDYVRAWAYTPPA
jgi:Glycosyl hydrolases family 16